MNDDPVRRLADELEIRNLVARLAHIADMGDLEAEYLPLFTQDATWEFPGSAESEANPAKVTGHEAILADRRQRRSDGFQGPETHTRHVNTTLAVRIDGSDCAEAESYWLFVTETNTGEPQVRGIGHYRDTFQRTPDGWKIARRQITPG